MRSRLPIIFLFALLLLTSCQGKNAAPTLQATPTAYPTPVTPLPPALTEVIPAPGSTLPLRPTMRFIFNQPMDTNQAGDDILLGLPAGNWHWEDERTLAYQATEALPPATMLEITLKTSAQAANGLALLAEQVLRYQIAAPLRLAEAIPAPQAADVSPRADLIVTFTQPVVPLGADPGSGPAAFTLSPAVEGEGHWLNTSTYRFRPTQPLTGGSHYQIALNPNLKSLAGAPLEAEETSWQFTIALPEITAITPAPEETPFLDLDATFSFTFSQPMDVASTEAAFRLQDENGQAIPGRFAWDESFTRLTFTPSSQLPRSQKLQLVLGTQARAQGGGQLIQGFQAVYRTWQPFAYQNLETNLSLYGDSIKLSFSAPLDEHQDLDARLQLEPTANCSLTTLGETTLYIFCPEHLQRETTYRLWLSADLRDRWGQKLSQPYELTFQTPPAASFLALPHMDWSSVVLVPPDTPQIRIQHARLNGITLALAPQDVETFLNNAYTGLAYTPVNARSWYHPLNDADGQIHTGTLTLSPDGRLAPGLYALQMTSDAQTIPLADNLTQANLWLVASHINLTLKAGATEAIVWAVDARSGAPIAQAPVRLYQGARLIASGQTDENGIWQSAYPPIANDDDLAAVIGHPGEATFGLSHTRMNDGLDQHVYATLRPPENHLYLYTDRPLYKPGQTLYFRGILRQAFDARYTLDNLPEQVRLEIRDERYQTIDSLTLPVDDWGIFYGEYALPAEMKPGNYVLYLEDWGTRSFRVAHYIKPSFEITFPTLQNDQITGADGRLTLAARYYFGAPVGNLPVRWSLYEQPLQFSAQGYTFGLPPDCPWWMFSDCADWVSDGEGVTDAEGQLTLALPTDFSSPRLLRADISAEEPGGYSLNLRQEIRYYPSETLIGLKTDRWIASVAEGIAVSVQLFDTSLQTLPAEHPLTLRLEAIHWQYDPQLATWEAQATLVEEQRLTTNPRGRAEAHFAPETGGFYRLTVSGAGSQSQLSIWVSGRGLAYGSDPALTLHLQSNQSRYHPGEEAQIYIPNPFGTEARALILLTRGRIHAQTFLTIPAEGGFYTFTLTDEHAPNIFVDVTLLAKDYRTAQGYLELEVEPRAQTLHLALTEIPQQAQPGESITLKLRVTDAAGNPVQGRFSLAVADLAALALSEDNAPHIVEAYYAPARPGFLQGISGTRLAARFHTFRFFGGIGGGGGADTPPATLPRQDFRDTAFWNPQIETDSNGHASVSFTLPDNLTTWKLTLRGLTRDTRVGETSAELTTAKPLQIIPVVPSFFVVGDQVSITAQVFNNTDRDLTGVTVSLQPRGFLLADPATLTQQVDIPARAQVQVSWEGRIQPEESVSLLFSARGGGYEDQTFPEESSQPVYAYLRPQTFITAGILADAETRLETINLPPATDQRFGALHLYAAPTLAGVLLPQLSAQPPASEQDSLLTQTYDWLMRLSLSQSLQMAGYQDISPPPNSEALLARLAAAQREDGAWSWWPNAAEGDLRLTTDLLTALTLADQLGQPIPPDMRARARAWLDAHSEIPTAPGYDRSTDQLDLLAQIAWVSFYNGGVNSRLTEALFSLRPRLSPRGQVFLALQISGHNPDDERAQALFAALQRHAHRSASDAYWVYTNSYGLPQDTLLTTALVAWGLASYDPASPLLADASHYLLRNRSAAATASYAYRDAWLALAFGKAMQANGDLAAQFQYTLSLNGQEVLSGSAGTPASWDGVSSQVALQQLNPQWPNPLSIQRTEGPGRLYYRADLEIYQPAEEAAPIQRGLTLTRTYYDAACNENCAPLTVVPVSGNRLVRAELTLVVPEDMTNLEIEDFFPAGAQVIDVQMKTQRGLTAQITPNWRFSPPVIYPQRIRWNAPFLPAGTYTLTYLLNPLLPGEYHVLPAHTWRTYFPDVQATTGGTIFRIQP